MVFAFIIHTLFPGQCNVLYQQIFHGKDTDLDDSDTRTVRKQLIEDVASEVHSEYQFRRAVGNRSVDEDIQKMNNEDTLPEMELGFIRVSGLQSQENIAIWQGAGNTGFILLCDPTENRMLAETNLKLIINFLQNYVRLLNQPTEVISKPERVGLVLNKFLPDGNLIFMNHRVVRQLEKELETLMKL